MIDLKKLIENGVAYGHQTWRWCPKMRPYIWGQRNGIHLIDVSKTAFFLDKAAKFLESIASQGKPVLWVGTKKAAQDVVMQAAKKIDSPYVTHRWIGGTITNFDQVKKSRTKLLHLEDVLAKSDQYNYTKKEFGVFQKTVDRLEKNIGGIRKLTWPIGALVVVDVKKEHVAIKEARAAGVPIVGLVDTNSDPSVIDFVIPANDDLPRSIHVIIEYLAEATQTGKATAQTKQVEEAPAEQMIEQLLEQALGTEDEDENKPRRHRSTSRSSKRVPTKQPVRTVSRSAVGGKFVRAHETDEETKGHEEEVSQE